MTSHKSKSLVALLAALAIVLLLAACGGNGSAGGTGDSGGGGSEETQEATDTAQTTAALPKTGKKTIGVISLAPNNGGSGRMIKAMESFAGTLGWSVRVINAEGDPQKVSSGVQSLISAKVDGIVVDILDPSAIAPDIAAAKKAGIPFISVNSNDLNPDVSTQIVANPFEIGVEQATQIADAIGREGSVALLGYSGSSNISQRQAALEGALKTYPGIKIVEDHEVDITNPVDDSTNAVQGWLTKYPKGQLDAIWAAWDEPAIGAATAIEAAGRSSEIDLVGADYSPQSKQLMEGEGPLKADWYIDYPKIGEAALESFAHIFAGEKVAPHQYMETVVVTPESLPSGEYPPAGSVFHY
ncbi:MAG TPA: sugar ABC transporter substrate-binding protein [Solirubrobacterales bacterium]